MTLAYTHYLIGSYLVLNAMLIFSLFLFNKKAPQIKNLPNLSVIIPAYNAESTIKECIESLYESYPKEKIDLIIINDKSKDNTSKIIQKLRKIYNFKLIENSENKGKTESVNSVVNKTKNELILFMDSDMISNKKTLVRMISEISVNEQIAAVGGRYKPKEKGIFPALQEMEYNLMAAINYAASVRSTFGLWGGYLITKKRLFISVGKFSKDALTEDQELIMKYTKMGYISKQLLDPVLTETPKKLKQFYKQRIRWAGGMAQNFLRYPKEHLKNPVLLALICMFLLHIISILTKNHNQKYLEYQLISNLFYQTIGNSFLKSMLFGFLVYPLSNLGYIFVSIGKNLKQIQKTLIVYPFTLIYLPILIFLHILGYFYGIFKMIKGDGGWKGSLSAHS